jgi:hypothetical protein
MDNGQTAEIQLRLFDGTRQQVQSNLQTLIRIRDGNQNELLSNYYPASAVPIFKVPFYNNFGDYYAVIAFADTFIQTGFYPVKGSLVQSQRVDLMLLPKNGRFNFRDAQWTALQSSHSDLVTLLSHGAGSTSAARDRYEQFLETHAPSLACFFNLTTAMANMHLSESTPLTYLKELIWDASFAQDRFFAYADIALVDEVRRAAAQGLFAPEPGPATFHKGATSSYKQIQFGEANVQLTFHENNHREIEGVDCIIVEPDIDYYKDLGGHTLLEVIPNALGSNLTDPKTVYMLRWIAGRRAGVPEFDPPYTIDSA